MCGRLGNGRIRVLHYLVGERDIPPTALLRGGGRQGMVRLTRATARSTPCLRLPLLRPPTSLGPPTAPRRPLSSSYLVKLRPSNASTGSSVSAASRVRGQQRRATHQQIRRTSVNLFGAAKRTIIFLFAAQEGPHDSVECCSSGCSGLEVLVCCRDAPGP